MKYTQVQFHQDHIHPRAGFDTAALRSMKLDDETIGDWQAKRDALPNLQLLEGRENSAKRATPFEDWLAEEYPEKTDARTFLKTHHIPNVSLDLAKFGTFFDKRRALLKQKLSVLLATSAAAKTS